MLSGNVAASKARCRCFCRDAPGLLRKKPGGMRKASCGLPWRWICGPVGRVRSTGNLTLDLYVEINKNTTPELIADDMAYQLRHGFEGRIKKYDQLVKYIPLRLVRFGAQKMIRDRHRKGRYGLSGIFSNLGRVDLNFSAEADFPPGRSGLSRRRRSIFRFFWYCRDMKAVRNWCFRFPKTWAVREDLMTLWNASPGNWNK